MQAWRIRVRGLVQGVGFRPHVWRLAAQFGFKGKVLNDSNGVEIELFCRAGLRDEFIAEMRQKAPLLARIDSVDFAEFEAKAPPNFTITASKTGKVGTGITPDATTCPDCLADVLDPKNRRYRYPFTNCTHCGPRLTITRKIPYDRANTAMAKFPMCAKCQAEYNDPADRRYHAQPNACADCGPRLTLVDSSGAPVAGEPIEATAALIRAGKIVAIKGLGGFQLAVDALNSAAIALLRSRKHRPAKPLALMVKNVEMAGEVAHLSAQGRDALQSWQAPIVLLASKNVVAPEIAPNQSRIGLMLPNTPLHHVLLQSVDRPIVLTSGNPTGDPQVIENAEALDKLAHIADYFLLHNRDIVNRVDDSVVQPTRTGPQIMRRARGYAPAPIALPEGLKNLPATIAMGGDMKNTFCLLGQGSGIVSQHMGEMDNPATQRDFLANLELYQQLYDFKPERVVVDAHPSYFSTRMGEKLAAERGLMLVSVQHHHAHVAAVMAEHGLPPDAAPVLGIVLDGLGYGADGTIWGGEFLRVNYKTSSRLAHIPSVALLGGDKANHQPWRNLFAHLSMAFSAEKEWRNRFSNVGAVRQLETKPLDTLTQILNKGLNSPISSSAGRLFDAVAALLGVNFEEITFEGEAAMKLQAMAEEAPNEIGVYVVEDSKSWRGLWVGIFEDLQTGVSKNEIAKKFHNSLIAVLQQTVVPIVEQSNYEYIILSGGVFQNRLLLNTTTQNLHDIGVKVLVPKEFPANDGGLSFGQAVIGSGL